MEKDPHHGHLASAPLHSTGGSWKRSDWSGSSKWDNPPGNRGHKGFGTYHQMIATAPAPDPTR